MKDRVAIIGAGIAGLCTGIYAAMNGFEVDVFEAHTQPGGLCTSWKRRGYTIDGCIHWLTGSAPGDSFYPLWKEIGIIDRHTFVDHEVFFRFVGADGRVFKLFADPDCLEAHIAEISPADAGRGRELARLVRRFLRFRAPVGKAPELYGFLDIVGLILRMTPYMRAMNRANSVSISDFADTFSDPLIREGLKLSLSEPSCGLFTLIAVLALLANRAGGYPLGGSLAFSRSIEARLLELGGRIHYGRRVARILTTRTSGDGGSVGDGGGSHDMVATGVELADGEVVAADFVVSAADLRSTLYGLLDGKHINPVHERLLNDFGRFPSMVQVSFGVAMELRGPSEALGEYRRLEKPIQVEGEEKHWILIKDYRYDPSLSAEGKNILVCSFPVHDFGYWSALAENRDAYEAEKARLAAECRDVLSTMYPGFSESVEVVDVVTPMTYRRYAGVDRGSFMTWVMTPDTVSKLRFIPKTLPGLARAYLAGMWVMSPGGVPTGLATGRHVVQMMCRDAGRTFGTRHANAAGQAPRAVAR